MQSTKVSQIPWYEVLYYMDHDGVLEDFFTEDFSTEEEALRYYRDHKNDPEKYGWKVTKRGYGFRILKCYVKAK